MPHRRRRQPPQTTCSGRLPSAAGRDPRRGLGLAPVAELAWAMWPVLCGGVVGKLNAMMRIRGEVLIVRLFAFRLSSFHR